MTSNRQILENIRRLLGYAVLVIIVLAISSKLMAAERYLPLGDGDSIITYDGIPFDLDGTDLSVLNTGSEFGGTPEFRPIDTIDLSGYIADSIHLLEAAAFATNVPNGVTVGTIKVYYDDGSFDAIELIMGLNIAEWAYDRPENQCCLAHNKVTPAYSDLTNIDSQYDYLAHLFYVYIDTQDKPLDYLELSLHEASYTGQPDCPQDCVYYHGLENWFEINIDAITIESSVEPIIKITQARMVSASEMGIDLNVTIPSSDTDGGPWSVRFTADINGTLFTTMEFDLTDLLDPGDTDKEVRFDYGYDPRVIDLDYYGVPRFSTNQEFELIAILSTPNYEDEGTKQVEIYLPVVILHGWTGEQILASLPLRIYESLIDRLSDEGYTTDPTWYRTIWYDRYRSQKMSPEEVATWLDSIVTEALGSTYADKINIIGHSIGGLVGRYYVTVHGGGKQNK